MSDPVVLLSTGDVVGPAGGVTDNSMVLFSGTSGKFIKGNNAVVTAAGLAILDDVNAAAQRTTLGLGTAATATLTTSATDTTAGRVLKVGDFGLGTTAVHYGGDLNLLGNVTGFYRTTSGATNFPNGCLDSCFVHIGSGDTYSQTFVGYGSSRMFTRGGEGVVPNINWQPWREVALTDSPAFTGTPTAPTASVGTSTTQVATTAFVNAEIANDAPTKTGGGASGSWGISITGSAAWASGVDWSGVSSKPTTLGGYGITDALPIWGGAVTGRTVLQKTGQVDWLTSSIEIGATDGGQAILAFHRHGVEAGTLRLNGGFHFDNSVTVYGAVNATNLLGQGQTWQDVTSSRTPGVIYTNTSGRPICVKVTHGEAGSYNRLSVDGLVVDESYQNSNIALYITVSAIVPSGSTYQLYATGESGAYVRWMELR